MQTLEWLQRLIAHDTTSAKSNLTLIDDVQSWLTKHGITSHLSYDTTQTKANLLATLPASDGKITGGIMLSGHTDVVPVAGQAWDTDPFKAALIDEKVFGRGACDMKGFIACVLAKIPRFKEMRLRKPVHFAFTYDEEVGCEGAPLLIEQCQSLNLQPEACIVGEPSNMQAIIAHKGIQTFRCAVKGKAAHSSLTPAGCNSIEYAAQMIVFLRNLAQQLKVQGPFDSHFDVPFTTLSTNQIQGGIAINTIPEDCQLSFEFRQLPTVDPLPIIAQIEEYMQQTLRAAMHKEAETSHVSLEMVAQAPAFAAMQNARITELVRQLTNTTQLLKVAYATEAGLFQRANIATVVCGPGSITEAHRPNEYVTLEQLQKCENFLEQVVQAY